MNIVLISCNNFYDWVATGHPNFGLGYVDLHLRGSEFLSMIQYITTGAAGNFHMINPGQELRSGRFHESFSWPGWTGFGCPAFDKS